MIYISGKGEMNDYECFEYLTGECIYRSNSPWFNSNKCSLTQIVVSEGITSVGKCSFICCDSVTTVSLPQSLTTAKSSSFSRLYSLSNIVLPDFLTIIEGSALDYSSITSLTLPASVSSLGLGIFIASTQLTEMYYLGIEEPSCEERVFENCPSLKLIKVPSNYESDEFCSLSVSKIL